ncbi:hypothetical protein TIFTF001_034582 [Ficus carica]|uniref:Receptor-like serine/threonine-protein kinase n=1 Tax=Ficus carica TaxID=3494 RepID=A0AA88E0S0_FICCA|nr:hypothetical protein TIFTF001_034582 [Ficus carica]
MVAFHLFTIFHVIVSLQSFLKFSSAAHIDAITPIRSIVHDDGNATTLVSAGQTLELGFFSPGNSKNRYLGIWYKSTPDQVVWIANRNSPLNDLNGELTIGDGNLVLLSRTRSAVWSSNVSRDVENNNPVCLLLDTGNLVLKEKESVNSEAYVWQSFNYPTDTLLEGMKLGWDLNTGFERYLTSWKSADDPSTGDFTYRMSVKGLPQVVLDMGSTRKFRTGTWNGVRFGGLNLLAKTIFKLVYVFTDDEAYLMSESTVNFAVSIVRIDYSGVKQRLLLHKGSTKWSVVYSVPSGELCENYAYCGANAICMATEYPICKCFQGYSPKSQQAWNEFNWSSGCKRKKPLDCEKGEGYVKVVGVKLPDMLDFWLDKNMSLKECEAACLKNCSCVAYANSDVRRGGSGCLTWFGDIIDVKEIHVKGSEENIYVRLSASDIRLLRDADKRKPLKFILGASVIAGICIFGIAFWCITWKLRKRVKGKSKDEDIDLPLFDLATIISATDNFSTENMIGKGGFGPVYKGSLSTRQEIAVKRLSKTSGQGLKELKNEVELIAKLQHRNLVALLGCCIQGEERILIYEYMPNKSLDHFIFDSKRSSLLPWEKRFDIVKGIARGLLYLHQDSKLQIIHRDLKVGNILLDINLNPKISDFGLARIFRDDEKEAEMRRVVGTHGYMSPEYAVDGKFSIKSDVFGFGVVLLEIVSGKKNRSFNFPDHHHNLLGHAWLLWNDEKALDLLDVCLKDSCIESQFPRDRPTMSSVVFMLENEGVILPQPKQPGFFIERGLSTECSMSRCTKDFYSENTMTITIPSGR